MYVILWQQEPGPHPNNHKRRLTREKKNSPEGRNCAIVGKTRPSSLVDSLVFHSQTKRIVLSRTKNPGIPPLLDPSHTESSVPRPYSAGDAGR